MKDKFEISETKDETNKEGKNSWLAITIVSVLFFLVIFILLMFKS